MAKYIDKERVVSLIKERRDAATSRQKNLEKIGDKSVLNEMVAFNLDKILETIDTLEVKEIHEGKRWWWSRKKERFVKANNGCVRTTKTENIQYILSIYKYKIEIFD